MSAINPSPTWLREKAAHVLHDKISRPATAQALRDAARRIQDLEQELKGLKEQYGLPTSIRTTDD